jgi:hypothetical protein
MNSKMKFTEATTVAFIRCNFKMLYRIVGWSVLFMVFGAEYFIDQAEIEGFTPSTFQPLPPTVPYLSTFARLFVTLKHTLNRKQNRGNDRKQGSRSVKKALVCAFTNGRPPLTRAENEGR